MKCTNLMKRKGTNENFYVILSQLVFDWKFSSSGRLNPLLWRGLNPLCSRDLLIKRKLRHWGWNHQFHLFWFARNLFFFFSILNFSSCVSSSITIWAIEGRKKIDDFGSIEKFKPQITFSDTRTEDLQGYTMTYL